MNLTRIALQVNILSKKNNSWALMIITSILLALRVNSALADNEAFTIVEKAFEARLSIKSYDVSIKFDHLVNPNGIPWISARYYYDGENVRCDNMSVYGKGERFQGLIEDSYRTVNIYRPDRHINFSFKKLPAPGQRVVEIDTTEETVLEKLNTAMVERDIRSLGFHPAGLFPNLPMDEMLKNLATPSHTVKDDSVAGVPCKKISLKLTTGLDCSVWIAPTQGYSILKCHTYFEEYDMANEIILKVEEWHGTGLWFPAHYESTSQVKGKLIQQTVAEIKVNSLNDQLPSETFQLSGIGIPAGRSVRTVPSSGPKKVWDGTKAVIKGSRPTEDIVEQKNNMVSWFLIVNGIFSALLCAYFIIRFRKS